MEWCCKKTVEKISCWLGLCSTTEFAQNLLQIIITSSFLYIYFIALYFNLCIKFNLLWLHASCLKLWASFLRKALFMIEHKLHFEYLIAKLGRILNSKLCFFLFSFVFFIQVCLFIPFCLFYSFKSFLFSFVFFIQFCLFYLVLSFKQHIFLHLCK